MGKMLRLGWEILIEEKYFIPENNSEQLTDMFLPRKNTESSWIGGHKPVNIGDRRATNVMWALFMSSAWVRVHGSQMT
jgi:hypothetical protein